MPEMSRRLAELFERTRGYKMTAEEVRQQRRSWVRGELMLGNPEMTWEEANERVLRAERQVYGD